MSSDRNGPASRGDRRRSAIFLAAIAAVVVIGIGDYLTGPLWSMQFFYLVPVAVVAAFVGRGAGIAVAMTAGIAGLVADVALDPGYSHPVIATFNVVFMLVTLVVIVELVEILRRKTEVAIDSERHGREFLAFAAHQLRTPLAAIRASVDALMMDAPFTPAQEDLLMSLGAETARASRLVNSLLRIARLDQHEVLPLREADLECIVRMELDRAMRGRPTLAWSSRTTGTTARPVRCNPDALAEALGNLLDNAGRHARSQVEVVVALEPDAARIEVRDDGPGLPPGKSDAAFERFVSLDGSGGSGLGLPIARGIVEAHGGDLFYDGHAFVVQLPRPARGSASAGRTRHLSTR
jgi:signal transduction histidine kinase